MKNRQSLVRKVIFAAIIIVTALFQNTFLPCSGITFSPFLLIPLTVAAAMCENELSAMALGLLAGMLWDIASPMPDGILALFFTIFGYTCSFLSHRILRKTFAANIVLTAVGTAFCSALIILLSNIIKDSSALPTLILKTFLPIFILTVIITPVYYFPIKTIDKKLKQKAGVQL